MIQPPATIGILGGGQLGRYFVMAAHELGYRVWVLDPDENSPAGRIADHHLCAAFDSPDALQSMASHCAVITSEFENVPAMALETLAGSLPVHPSGQAIAVCQDRIAEKEFLRERGFAHVPFAAIRDESDLASAPGNLFPGILKAARFGYDGKGQILVKNRKEATTAFQEFKGEPCILEKFMPLDYELSVVLVRSQAGEIISFPASRNVHKNGILHSSSAPARLLAESKAAAWLAEDSVKPAQAVAEALDYVGVLCVEFFVVEGDLLINEIAPRPHNSGHYTIDTCPVNQFEQQVRAITGLPLGNVHVHTNAIMVNLLGDLWFDDKGKPRQPDWGRLLAIPGLKLHLYGKVEARPGRKMGHFTILSKTRDNLTELVQSACEIVGIK